MKRFLLSLGATLAGLGITTLEASGGTPTKYRPSPSYSRPSSSYSRPSYSRPSSSYSRPSSSYSRPSSSRPSTSYSRPSSSYSRPSSSRPSSSYSRPSSSRPSSSRPASGHQSSNRYRPPSTSHAPPSYHGPAPKHFTHSPSYHPTKPTYSGLNSNHGIPKHGPSLATSRPRTHSQKPRRPGPVLTTAAGKPRHVPVLTGRGKRPLRLTPQQQSSLQRLAASSKLTAKEQAAVAGLLGLQFATAKLDRQMINQAASLIHSSRLTQEESQVVRQSVQKAVANDVLSEQAETGGVGFMMADSSFSADLLSSFADSSDGDAFVDAGEDASEVFFADNDEADEDGAYGDDMQTCRYLRVINDTGEKLEIHVQYRTLNSADDWGWYPADPAISDRSVAYDLDPGEATYLADGNWKLNANRVRIWAVSERGKHYLLTKDQDLWLVPEIDGVQLSYSSPRVQTFTLALAP